MISNSMNKILIMGLPGAGKTTLAHHIVDKLRNSGKTVTWLNADDIRAHFNDWDFSTEGRIRQSIRMSELATSSDNDYALCDFVAPLVEMRDNFNATWTIWVDTIDKGRFEDTNKAFIPPSKYDFRVTEQDAEKWSSLIVARIIQ
jgi:adenylylsulfate kinase